MKTSNLARSATHSHPNRRILTLALMPMLALTGLATAQAQTVQAPTVQAPTAPAASPAPPPAAPARYNNNNDPVQTFYLKYSSGPNEANELLTTIRNILRPELKMYLVNTQNAIVVRATPEDFALIQKLLDALDRPKKSFRLTYTLTESDAGKRIGVEHLAAVVIIGGRTTLKNGSRLPVATGSYTAGAASAQTQFTYLDVGLNIDASLDELDGGARLRTKIERSSVAEEKSGVGSQDPIVRQTVLEGTSFLTPGKPLTLGSLDIAGSTRHLEVEIQMDPIR